MQRIYILIFLCFFCANTSAQVKYKYNGIVVDAESNERLPYATLTIKELNSNKIIGGAESNENGEIFIIQRREETVLLDYGAEETTLYLDTLGSISVCLLYTSDAADD